MDVQISDAELDVMEVLWAAGQPLTAAEVADRIDADRGWTLATVKTMLSRLAAKGALMHARMAAASSILRRSSAKPMSGMNPGDSSKSCSEAVSRRWSLDWRKKMGWTRKTLPQSRRC